VLDRSATLAWVYGDETTEAIRRLFDAVADEGAIVPALWRLEVANSLAAAVRRGRIHADFCRASLADLALLDITTDQDTDFHPWGETLKLADRFQLTSYDAAYLELAARRSLPLATPLMTNCAPRQGFLAWDCSLQIDRPPSAPVAYETRHKPLHS
jgi:predicted nucleic acid-binding protein